MTAHEISARQWRAQRLAAALHSAALEGAYIPEVRMQPFRDYAEGAIDTEELVRRVRIACGLCPEKEVT